MFFLNPKRRELKTWGQKVKYYLQWPLIRLGLWLGFEHIDYSYHSGYPGRLKIGKGCSTVNTLFNTNSGTITVGDHTIFGYQCMAITGQHRFYQGVRSKLHANSPIKEVPDEGQDIKIGTGCWIGSGAIILGGVTIGDHVIIGAGSVVLKDIPTGCFAMGIPAQVIWYHNKG